jgi:hypothetical protein
MDTLGLDLHKRESQLCILTEAGEVTERRIVTSRERFAAVLGDRAPAVSVARATPRRRVITRESRGPRSLRHPSQRCPRSVSPGRAPDRLPQGAGLRK